MFDPHEFERRLYRMICWISMTTRCYVEENIKPGWPVLLRYGTCFFLSFVAITVLYSLIAQPSLFLELFPCSAPVGLWIHTAVSESFNLYSGESPLTRSEKPKTFWPFSYHIKRKQPEEKVGGQENALTYFVEPIDLRPWAVDLEETEELKLGLRSAGPKTKDNDGEATTTLQAALNFKDQGKLRKAKRLFEHALVLSPRHPDVLTKYGEFLESHGNDVVLAEKLYTRALSYAPHHTAALHNRQRALPLVEDIDNQMLQFIDQKREFFLQIPRNSPALRRAMREAYFLHVYHTVALEGNTMTLLQTRSILETHLAVGGKSVVEHNEILGMDQALRYLNRSLVHRIGEITVQDILEIHRRVLGFVDPGSAGVFRQTQVYVGDFRPVEAANIQEEMEEFLAWLNSESALTIHPVELAAIAHYKFVFIHPFIDGNGRTARLLMNLILMQAGFPPVIIRAEERLDYYETLRAANEGDLRPFIRFIARSTENTLDGYLVAAGASGDIDTASLVSLHRHLRTSPSQDQVEQADTFFQL